MLRYFSLLILTIVFGISCSCTSIPPPAVFSPPPRVPLSIPNYICEAPLKIGQSCYGYEKVHWNEWENPRLTVTPDRIKVVLPRSSKSITVPARYVADVLFENTTADDWLMGAVVIVRISEVSDHREMLERDRSELLTSLNHHGIQVVLEGVLPRD